MAVEYIVRLGNFWKSWGGQYCFCTGRFSCGYHHDFYLLISALYTFGKMYCDGFPLEGLQISAGPSTLCVSSCSPKPWQCCLVPGVDLHCTHFGLLYSALKAVCEIRGLIHLYPEIYHRHMFTAVALHIHGLFHGQVIEFNEDLYRLFL